MAACTSRVLELWAAGPGRFVFLRDWSGQKAGAIELFAWRPGESPGLPSADPGIRCSTARVAGPRFLRASAQQPRHLERIDLQERSNPSPVRPESGIRRSTGSALSRGSRSRASDGTPPGYADLVLPPRSSARPASSVGDRAISIAWLSARRHRRRLPRLSSRAGTVHAVLSFQRTPQVANDFASGRPKRAPARSMSRGGATAGVFSALEAAVDAAIARGVVDPQAIGISGMSDGASTAIWAIVNNPRYRVARDQPMLRGSLAELLRQWSRLSRRCRGAWGYPPPEQDPKGFWPFYSLRRSCSDAADADPDATGRPRRYRFALPGHQAPLTAAKRPVELYVFPDEYHIKWQPVHRAAMYRRSIAWFRLLASRECRIPVLATPDELARWQALRSAAGPGGL